MDAPDFSTPLVGFRAWTLASKPGCYMHDPAHTRKLVDHPAGILLSLYHRSPWMESSLQAGCSRVSFHAAPETDCECGIYAWWQMRELFGSRNGEIWGAVALWGRCEVYNKGLRAEYARIIGLSAPDGHGLDPQALALCKQRYQVPWCEIHELAALDQVPSSSDRA
jgi:hypothetical protein